MKTPKITPNMRHGVWFLTLRTPRPVGILAIRRSEITTFSSIDIGFAAAISLCHHGDEWDSRRGSWLAFRRLHQRKAGEAADLSAHVASSFKLAEWATNAVSRRTSVFNALGDELFERQYCVNLLYHQVRETAIRMVRLDTIIPHEEEFTPAALGLKVAGTDVRSVADQFSSFTILNSL